MPLLRHSRPVHGLLVAAVLAAGWAGASGPASGQSAGPPFESPAALLAVDVVPGPLLASAAHRVESEVRLEDNLLQIEVVSDYGRYEVTSVAMLEIRVREITTLAQAISQYERLNEKLAGEIRGRLQLPADASVQVLAAPLGAASDLSTQLSANDPILAARGGSQSSVPEAPDVAPRGPVYESHRRNVAYRLGLDPYSTNPHVRTFLGTVASARARGRFSAGSGLVLSAPEQVTRPVAKGRIDSEVARLVRHLDPAELDAGLEPEIVRMGASARLAADFLAHPSYSPRTKASIAAHVDHLSDTGGRAAVFDAALGARSEAEAVSFEQLARMLAGYHETVGRLERLIPGGPALPGAVRADGALVLMLPVDYVFWTASAQSTFDSLGASESVAAGRPVELVVYGRLSERARRALGARGVRVRESFLIR